MTGRAGRPVRGGVNRIAGILVPMLVLAGCVAHSGPPPRPKQPSPFAACTALSAPPAAASPGAIAAPGTTAAPAAVASPVVTAPARSAAPTGGADRLPDLTLPCLNGGQGFRLAELRGPAVVNLWASYCAPCRDELPALQRYAGRAAGRVNVVGVVTKDRPEAAASLATDLNVSLPALNDPAEQLLQAIPRRNLPVTVLIDENGGMRYVHDGPVPDDAALGALVERHLGVRV